MIDREGEFPLSVLNQEVRDSTRNAIGIDEDGDLLRGEVIAGKSSCRVVVAEAQELQSPALLEAWEGDYVVGAYFENIGIPVIRRGNTGNTRFMGLSVKNISGVGVNGKPLIFDLPDGLANFYASGIVRQSDQAVGYERSGVFYELIAESSFFLTSGKPNSAQRGYEVNVLEHVRNIPLALNGDTELRIGRRYFEDFGANIAHSVTFVGPVEEGKRVELRTESTGWLNLTMPESVIAGREAFTDEVALDAGYHVLVWEQVGGLWWLSID
jgi:hypothetical protein